MQLSAAPLPLSTDEKRARLRLIRSENVGNVTFARLLERFGSATDALAALPDLALRGGRKKTLKICSEDAADEELAQVSALDAVPVFLGEPEYPALLSAIDDAPPILFVRGHAALLCKRAVAVVGSRNASINGRRMATDIAQALGKAGFLVVSGMARGIDAAAHDGALSSGTLAVLGGGVDVIYPRENAGLYAALLEGGAICSEMPCGTVPQARHFPMRNRIISGISRGIVVIEAGARSRSLITARMALEQNREVFAVPGPPQDPRVKGANWLIREGAHLTESADDVLQILSDLRAPKLNEDRKRNIFGAPAALSDADLTKARGAVINALGFGPTDVDDLYRILDHPPQIVAMVLLELELAGRLERLAGNKVVLAAL